MDIEPLEGKALRAIQVPDDATLVMFDGAVRSSKTISQLLMWLRFIRTGPKGMLAIVGRTETSAINNMVMPLQDMLGASRVVLNRGTGTVTIAGRICQLYGANDEQARTKIQGLSLAGALVDEGANLPESFFNMLRSRLSVAGAMLFLTCNPEGPKHWLKEKWLDKASWHLDRDGRLHDQRTYDSDGELTSQPIWRVTFLLDDNYALQRNNPRFVRELETAWPQGSVFYRRYIRSEWVSAEGAVYQVWNEQAMTFGAKDLAVVDQVLMVGLDYGTNHATRAYLLGMVRVNVDGQGAPLWGSAGRVSASSPSRHVLVLLDEFAPESATVGEHARLFEIWLDRVSHWGQPEWLAIDPAAATFKAELFERGRNDVMNAHNSVLAGIQTMQGLLFGGRLYVNRDTCPELVKMFPGYMWSTKATERGKTEPVKENDDELDAARYAVYTARGYWRDSIPLAPIAADQDQETDAA